MDITPNFRIARAGFQYQEAAQVLEREHLLWPAAINASLAIEIYLKSFLAKDTWKDHPAGGKYKTSDRAEHGHNFIDLYNKISENFQNILSQKVNDTHNIKLSAELDKYKSVFFNARYMYEESAMVALDSGIIRLSEALKSAIDAILSPEL
jgi:hypothetical protein